MKIKREAFEARIIKTSSCWQWMGSHSNGYGLYGNGPNRYAHRVAYSLIVGDIPEDHHIHHTCNNKSCVNPGHLAAIHKTNHRPKYHTGPDVCRKCGGPSLSFRLHECRKCYNAYMREYIKTNRDRLSG